MWPASIAWKKTLSLDVSALRAYLPIVRRVAMDAGWRIQELAKSPIQKSEKPDHSIVTNADHAANDIILTGLRQAFPTHQLFSEETGREGPSSPYVWLIDPLDGTRAYAKGIPGYSVMIGLLYDEKPVLGVVYDPYNDWLYEASQGGGCFGTHAGDTRVLHVSKRHHWAEMPLITSKGFPDSWRDSLVRHQKMTQLAPINSVGIKVGYLVRQEADIYLNHHPVHYWDTLAPQVILEEAGGTFTAWDGSPLRYDLSQGSRHDQATVATNGHAHQDLLALIKNFPIS